MAWLLLVAVGLFAGAFLTFRRRRSMLDTPTALATSAAIGRAELSGVARGDPVSTSPVSGTACAWWEAELWEQHRLHGRRRWVMVAKETADVDRLWLEDRSGRIPVFLYAMHWELDEDEFSARRPSLPDDAHAFVERHGHRWDPAKYRVKERRLEEGGPVYVLGTVSEASAVIQGLSDDSAVMAVGRKLLKHGESLQHPHWQATSAGAGGRVGLSRATLDPVSAASAVLTPADVVVWCGKEGLLIGDGDQSKVARQLMRTTYYCLGGGVVMILLALML